jgi:FkbH-like protein
MGRAIAEREFREILDSLDLNPEHGEWDSIRHFNLVMELEARWGAKIPIESVGDLKTFDDFYVRLPYRPAKVLAVDADNTLWRGIVSEDGAEAVEPYAEFQRGLLELKRQGVFLVLLSKNDSPADGDSVIERVFARGDMPLKLTDFAYVGVNWEPKAGNLAMAAKALNLSADSFVFIDDNPHERAQMRAHLPEVMVYGDMERAVASGMVELAGELSSTYFADSGKTAEDRLRNISRPVFQDKPEYLKTLELKVRPSCAAESDIPRLAQMAGKTNQFNATTIRRSEGEFRALLDDSGRKVFVFRLSDKFGDMGIVCYVVVDMSSARSDGAAVITDFVMSCRAMGRTLEFFAYQYVLKQLKISGVETPPKIDFSPSAKNRPFAEFLENVAKGETNTYCSL